MSFRVEPTDIAGYADMVANAARDLKAGGGHVQRKATIELSGAASDLWKQVATQHKGHAADAKALFEQFEDLMRSSGDELARSAKYYQKTDQDEAASVDALAPTPTGKVPGGPPAGLILPGFGGDGFADRVNAQDALVDAPGPGFFEARWNGKIGDRLDGVMNNPNGALGALGETVGWVLDATSPSVLVNEALKTIFNFDLFDRIAQWMAGDWGSFEDCAEAWTQLGELCAAVATNISYGNDLLNASWSGKAASTAWEYFNGTATKLASAQETFNALHGCYEEIAGQINAFVNMLKGAISTICDLALIAFLEMAAGSAAAGSVFGAPAAPALYAAAALKMAKAVQLWDNVGTGLTGLYLTIQGAQAAGQSATSMKMSEIKAFPRPGRAYDHVAV